MLRSMIKQKKLLHSLIKPFSHPSNETPRRDWKILNSPSFLKKLNLDFFSKKYSLQKKIREDTHLMTFKEQDNTLKLFKSHSIQKRFVYRGKGFYGWAPLASLAKSGVTREPIASAQIMLKIASSISCGTSCSTLFFHVLHQLPDAF